MLGDQGDVAMAADGDSGPWGRQAALKLCRLAADMDHVDRAAGERERKILEYVVLHGKITRSTAAELCGLEGREALSQLFSYELLVVARDPEGIDGEELVGADQGERDRLVAEVAIDLGKQRGQPALIRGVLQAGFVPDERRRRLAEVEVRATSRES